MTNLDKIDLFTVFVEGVDKLAEQGLIEKDARYERAMAFVEELVERREALGKRTRKRRRG